ncbi:HAD-IIIC family phosphatase [Rufibacter soli]
MEFKELKKNLKKDFSAFKHIKVAILGDTATQFLKHALKGYGYEAQLNLEIFEADYDQIDRQVFDPSSEYYAFKADFTIIYASSQKLVKKFYKIPVDQRHTFAEILIDNIHSQYESIQQIQPSKVVYFNFSEINDSVYGNFANKVASSFLYQVRKLNYELMNLSQAKKNLFINDLVDLERQYGVNQVINNQLYINSSVTLSIDFLPAVAKNILDILLPILGRFKKCLVLDLDNTTWGGIIGDDGMENIQIGELGIGKAFSDLQLWAKELERRGIILAVCSKNDEAIAQEPFQKHPDMVLRLEDIAIFVANWDNKVDNIRHIQSVLNIGFDSMVFLDDNPFERNMVRENVPGIEVPELPEDPADYISYLRTLNLFETASFSENDADRTRQYQVEAKRAIVQQSFANEADFLKNLEMVSEVTGFDKFNTPRVSQLTQRSNQFNLRTMRYTDEEIVAISHSEEYANFAFSLKDKFGDYGLISVVIMKKKTDQTLFIDTWIMSCRVLKRGMEFFALDQLVNYASEYGFAKIVGEYLPTPKNELVKDHYQKLGFMQENGLWVLPVEIYQAKDCFITKA